MTTNHRLHGQRGVALPVMLIMMLVMLITSVYLLRSSNSATLAASNLAYDATLSRAVDLGLHTGFRWLQGNRVKLNGHDTQGGYRASYDPSLSPRDAAFWTGSATIDDGHGNKIVYVIHRLCNSQGVYNTTGVTCTVTVANGPASHTKTNYGDSLAIDAPAYGKPPQVHYVITARLDGVRGGNVINQMVVLAGA